MTGHSNESLRHTIIHELRRRQSANANESCSEKEVFLRATKLADQIGVPLDKVLSELRLMDRDNLVIFRQYDPLTRNDVMPWVKLRE